MGLNTTYIPQREGAMLAWSNNLVAKLVADPVGYGIVEKTATDYQAVQVAFATAYALANDPDTRNKPSIADKNTKKKALLVATRPLVQTLQASPEMTNAKREQLELPIRDTEPTPIGPPEVMPVLRVASVSGRIFNLELRNTEDQRRKPKGVRAANIFSFVGDTPPNDLKQWTYERGTTKSNPQVVFPDSVAAGTAVWLTALWLSPTDEPGPACGPVKAFTNHQGLSQAA